MNELKHLPASCTKEKILTILQSDGGVIVDNYIEPGLTAKIYQELEPYLEATETGTNDFVGHNTKRVGAIMSRSPSARELALDPLINSTCQDFLSPYCDHYQLHLTQAVSIGPGQGTQTIHRDRGVWEFRVPREIETQFSTIWALTDFTRENGATQIIPGSHLWPDEREPQDREIAFAEMQAGSVLIYSGSVLHGGGQNRTGENRIGLLLHYTLGWLRQEENQYLACPPHIAKEFSPELRALIGYKSYFTLGFCTLPSSPAESQELVSPEALFRRKIADWPGL